MAQWPNICQASIPKVAGLSPAVFTLYYVFFYTMHFIYIMSSPPSCNWVPALAKG